MFSRQLHYAALGLLVLALVAAVLPTHPVRAEGTIHTVQPGETLFRIGLRYGVTWQTLMVVNGLTSITIYPGQQLIIPDGAVDTGGRTVAAGPEPAVEATSAPAPGAAPPPATAAGGVYVVKAGDALWVIARRFQVSVNDLVRANGLSNARWIYAGQTLTIPGGLASQAAPAPGGAPAPAPVIGKQLTVSGRGQALPLDCEARAAVDWAGYFGAAIDELEFFGRLPVSDDPDVGFVGDVYGAWGQIPPAAYGVHADPVAALLNQYGVQARAAHGLSWEALQAEIDADRPVLVWVVGHVWNGTPVNYTAPSSGRTTVVAAHEHTVIVVGYGADTVSVLDGGSTYTRTRAEFMASWGVLGNMAIVR